jgi:hypothetical protein
MVPSHVERHPFLKEKKKRAYNTQLHKIVKLIILFTAKIKKLKNIEKAGCFFQDVLDFLSRVLALSIDSLNQICHHAESVFLLFPFLKKEKELI